MPIYIANTVFILTILINVEAKQSRRETGRETDGMHRGSLNALSESDVNVWQGIKFSNTGLPNVTTSWLHISFLGAGKGLPMK